MFQMFLVQCALATIFFSIRIEVGFREVAQENFKSMLEVLGVVFILAAIKEMLIIKEAE